MTHEIYPIAGGSDEESLSQELQDEVWELVQRGYDQFLPASPRRLGREREGSEPFVAFGLTQTVFPVEGYIHTTGNPDDEHTFKIERVDVLQQLLTLGRNAQSGDRSILVEKRFPSRTIHHFLFRGDHGVVIQEYESREKRAYYPIVLHEEEIPVLHEYFTAIDTQKSHINHPLYSSHPESE
jgi:hypothetical protein